MVQSAIGWAGTCDTAGKPSRPGWSSGPTGARKPGARNQSLAVREAAEREPSQLGLEEALEHLGRPGRALLAAHVDVGGVAGAGASSLPYCFEHGSSSGVFDLATEVRIGGHAYSAMT
jgi:hypothetical protein